MIAILDYGRGNLFSIRNAFKKIGAQARLVSEPGSLSEYSAIVIPGVGAFDAAMKNLSAYRTQIAEVAKAGTPIMGICLGMQVFLDRSEEGCEKGLGLIEGDVVRLPETVLVPQIGWNEIKIKTSSRIFDGISDKDFFYFVHSYHCVPKDAHAIAASTDYGGEIAAALLQDNVFAVQFHPEKSGPKGLLLLENFVRDCRC